MVDWRVCPSCGYALQGLVEETPIVTCPECGHRWGVRALRENDMLAPPIPWGRLLWIWVPGVAVVALAVVFEVWVLALPAFILHAVFVGCVLGHFSKRRHGEFAWVVNTVGGISIGFVLASVEFLAFVILVHGLFGR